MSEESFVKLPRSLLENPKWIDTRPTHKTIFLVILEKAAYAETPYNIHGNTIVLRPGQLCVSIRKLEDWCGKWITKGDVEGSLKHFFEIKFLRQEVRHGKTVLTITEPSICDHFTKLSKTTSKTKVRQHSDTKEEIQEIQEPPPSIPSSKNGLDLDGGGGIKEKQKLSAQEMKALDYCMELSKKEPLLENLTQTHAEDLLKKFGLDLFNKGFKESFDYYRRGGRIRNFPGFLQAKITELEEKDDG